MHRDPPTRTEHVGWGGHQIDRTLGGGEDSRFEAQDTMSRESVREKW